MSLIKVGDDGATITIDLHNTTIPGGAVVKMILEKPTGLTVEITVTSVTNFATGIITYETTGLEINEIGEYKVEIHVTYTGVDITSNQDTFQVYKKLVVTPP